MMIVMMRQTHIYIYISLYSVYIYIYMYIYIYKCICVIIRRIYKLQYVGLIRQRRKKTGATSGAFSPSWSIPGSVAFEKCGTPKSWMAYDGKSESKMDDLGVPPWLRKCPFQEGKPSFKAGISWNFEGKSWTFEGFDGICWSPIPLPTPQSVVLVIKIHDRKREKVLSDKGTASLPYDLRSTFEVAAKKMEQPTTVTIQSILYCTYIYIYHIILYRYIHIQVNTCVYVG